MDFDISTLPEDTAALKNLIVSLADSHTDLEEKNTFLEERIRLLQNELFGRKSEKHIHPEKDPQQLYLFDEPELPEPENAETITVPAHIRKKRGRKPLPKDLPRIDVIHDIDESEKTCSCGCRLTKIGEEKSEKLDIIPAKMQVIRHIRYKYACKNCEGVDDDGPTVKIASSPVQFIPKGIATPGLVAHISLFPNMKMPCRFTDRKKFLTDWGLKSPGRICADGP